MKKTIHPISPYWLLFILLLGGNVVPIVAQDIEAEAQKLKGLTSLPKKLWEQGIALNGGISSYTTFYQDNSLEPTGRAPFESIWSANMNVNFFGKVQMPFSFTLNSQNVSFKNPFDEKLRYQQPFNRYQFKPTYKSLTVLLGVNSLNFSPNTLAGHRYEGLGIQFKPKKKPYFASFMLGTLQKSVRKDSTGQTPNNRLAYAREGWAFQLGYKGKKQGAEISFLKSSDVINSLPYSIDSVANPESNVVIGFKGNSVLHKLVDVSVDVAYSGLSKDIRDATFEPVSNRFSFGGLLHTNRSTVFRTAIKTGINYHSKGLKTGLEYSRVDPDYRTHGAYYFANDLENIALKLGGSLLSQKLSLNTSLGRQRNNLNAANNLQTLWQWVGSLNVVYASSEKQVATFNYSSFRSFTNLRSDLEYLTSIAPYSGLDTLNYRQVNETYQGNLMQVLPSSDKELKKMLMVTGMYQRSSNQQGGLTQLATIGMLNLQYSYANQPSSVNYSTSLNITRNDIVLFNEWLLGPSMSYSRSLLNKHLKTNAGLTYLKTWGSGNQSSNIFNGRFNLSATLQEQHQLSLVFLWMYRKLNTSTSSQRDYWDMTATLSYQYTLSTHLFKPKTP